jgi:hypothetical protein
LRILAERRRLVEGEELFRPLGIEGQRAQRRQFGAGPDSHPFLVVQILDGRNAL